jgi:hypothetical protein
VKTETEENMFNTLNANRKIGARWDGMQQPVHGTAYAADTLRLLAALDAGWQIVEAADMLAHGANAEGRGYVLTLMHPRRLLTREWNVMASPEMDALLAHEVVPMAR